nr:2934_t:CDS:2 [Entrophospora candida]
MGLVTKFDVPTKSHLKTGKSTEVAQLVNSSSQLHLPPVWAVETVRNPATTVFSTKEKLKSYNMATIQQLFDKKYSEKKEEEIQFSDLNEGKISASELTIDNFPNLRKLNVNNIKSLTRLKIINCPQLVGLDCQNNDSLIGLNLSECNELMKVKVSNNLLELIELPTNSEKLSFLEINDNNFPSQDLSFLIPYKNLEVLDLGNNSNEKKVKKGIYNRFYGIKGTDIDSGLEYLSENLQRLNCPIGVRVEAKEQKVETKKVNSSNNRKKNKNAKQKEKLEIIQEEIKQLKKEIEKLRAENQELNGKLINSSNINQERTENETLQQQIASQQNELKTLQEDLQNNRSSYTKFVNETLQTKKKEVENLTKKLSNLQNQVEIPPKS